MWSRFPFRRLNWCLMPSIYSMCPILTSPANVLRSQIAKLGMRSISSMASFLLSLVALSFLTSLVASSRPAVGVHGVRYDVTNNALSTLGGQRFQSQVGTDFSVQLMRNASSFVWKVFRQAPADRKDVHEVHLFVKIMDGIANTDGYNNIYVGADYVGNVTGDIRLSITEVLFHEVAHVWQWHGQGTAPGGLTEGVADYVVLKAGLGTWAKPGKGSRWDVGYDVTALASFQSTFVADLNRMMKNKYSESYFERLLGKTVHQLWADYKAKYGDGRQ
ncbi:hypothetical protein Taro_005681 [Colocasia esculenta]|uniref:Uncharacterized protein n=1 Tax=Colocasia esculenta TaxID=4460 RepID=A0A843TYJ9_COLES|nr:hypothetical protein [Colocasia esculenta]